MSQNKKKNPVNTPKNSGNSGPIVRFLVKKSVKEKTSNISDFIKQKIAAQVEVSEQQITNSEQQKTTSIETSNFAKELAEEKKKNEQLTNDLKKSVAFIREFEAISLTKDIQIEKLSRQLERVSLDSKDEHLFSEFSDNFNPAQLKELRSVKSGLSKDSTFVLKCMRFLYPNPIVLNSVSLTGKPWKQKRKEKMCDTKM